MSTRSLLRWLGCSCSQALGIGVAVGIGLCLLAIALSRSLLIGGSTVTGLQPVNEIEVNFDEENARLQSIATSALGQREGTIVVVDPQTGQVRAVVNPILAFQRAFPPGSTVKPFTALTALRAGVIDEYSRMRCRENYQREQVIDACSHPRNLAPLNPAEAIAYSCNYYFTKVGAQLKKDDLSRTLVDFGFGRVTGINAAEESNGVLVLTGRQPKNAIGEGRLLQVTPIQLLMAYAALVNGGRLLRPALAPAAEFTPRIRAQLQISEAERTVLLEGMRGAVKFGTAQKARLISLPGYVVGKTGTSTSLQGFRSQGWFVGLAFRPDTMADPTSAHLGVVVFLKNSHGAEAAEVARPIFEAATSWSGGVSRSPLPQHSAKNYQEATFDQASDSPPAVNETYVRIHQVTENVTTRMRLEEYILYVVAIEGSVEDEPEALKALAIAARTYALKNLKRHSEQGYDFCSTTHCQRFALLAGKREVRPTFVAAVKETNGLVLKDEQGHIADSYFGASCGGMTANVKTLWGTDDLKYLRGVRDDYCASGAHSHWTDVIPAERLASALRSDPRTDVGKTIRALFVARQDETGRAERISIVGERGRTISGWEFKLIVGRSLGWNVLKSSRFTVSRVGSEFVFRGSGFGHGLGLCQEGAHVMAQKGFSFRQILAKYFPGTSVGDAGTRGLGDAGTRGLGDVGTRGLGDAGTRGLGDVGTRGLGDAGTRGLGDVGTRRWGDAASGELEKANARSVTHADLLWPISNTPRLPIPASPPLRVPASPRLLVSPSPRLPISASPRPLSRSSSHFRVIYPQTIDPREVDLMLRFLESNRSQLSRRLSAAGIQFPFPDLEIFINETTGDFVGRTGMVWWAAAATRANRIELQPLQLLKQRRILETTLRHELVHVAIDAIGGSQTPRWLSEGMALYVAGEGKLIQRDSEAKPMSLDVLEQSLRSLTTAAETQRAYAAAYNVVRDLIRVEGEKRVWRRIFEKSFSLLNLPPQRR